MRSLQGGLTESEVVIRRVSANICRDAARHPLSRKEPAMTRLIDRLSARAARRARYARTVRALRAMPLDVALDLDLHRGDAERLAARAVYGA
jgi:uncharacterized protein YjiS (DUF1127 family)